MTVSDTATGLAIGGGLLLVLRTLMGVADSNLVLVSRSRLRELLEDGDERAARLERVIDDRHTVHASLSLCRGAMSVMLGAIAVWLPALFERGTAAEATSLALVVLLTLFLELAARRLAFGDPERLGLMLVPFYGVVHRLTQPLLRPLSAMVSGMAGMFGQRAAVERDRGVTEGDIRIMVDSVRDIEESEKEMIHSILELSETVAREIMVPRVDMVAVEKRTPLDGVLDLCLEHGLSRLPVYESSIDNVVGIVTSKDLLRLTRDRRLDTGLPDIIRPVLFVPASKPVDALLREMQRGRVGMAIVVDEYGGTDGLVTMEDLIEEIVGDITDEHDEGEPAFVVCADGSVVVDAKMLIDDFNDELGLHVETDDYDTVGGFVYGLFGHAPSPGERTACDGLVLSAEEVLGQRIIRVRVSREGGQRFELPSSDSKGAAAPSGHSAAPDGAVSLPSQSR